MTRAEIEAAVRAYFDALDRLDPAAAAALFAEDALLTCVNEGLVLRGREAIRGFFGEICAESRGMEHELTGLVVDAERRRAAAELVYRDDLADGRRYDMENCDFFELDAAGHFSRVRFWLGGHL